MNKTALDDFVESASEVWEKRFRNSSKHSSVDEWLNMMRFNLQQIRWDLIDSWANNEDSLSWFS